MTLEKQVSIDFYESRLHPELVEKLRIRAERISQRDNLDFDDVYLPSLVEAYTNYLKVIERREK